MKIEHTVEYITKSVAGAVVDTALGSELFPMVDGKFPNSIAISIANTDASDKLYVQLVPLGTPSTLSATVFTECIPALESRQFQVKRGTGVVDPTKQIQIYILGAASPGTTYTAHCFI